MPALTKDDVKDWGLPKLRDEYGQALDRAQSIKEQNGGTLTGVAGDVADEVKNILDSTNVLGERIDDLKSLDDADTIIDGGRKRLEGVQRPPMPGGGQGPGQGKGRPDGPRDVGGVFLESDAWKAFHEEGTKGVTVQVPLESLFPGYKGIGEVPGRKALFSTGDFPSPADFLAQPVEELFQENNIGPMLAQFTTGAATVRYPVETVTASGAATVAEGGTKPEADVDFAPTDEPIRKIAVWLPITDEALDDIPFLRSYINARLRLFVQNEEDRQLLIGDGTGTNLVGLLNRSGIDASTSYSVGGTNPDQALIDSIFSAAMRVREAKLTPDGFVTRPATWETARLAKDGNRNYLLGAPAEDAPVRVWGLPGRLNENMPAEHDGGAGAATTPVLVGAFGTGAAIVRRSGIDLSATDSHASHFAENKIAIRGEERVGLATFRPAAFATVSSAA